MINKNSLFLFFGTQLASYFAQHEWKMVKVGTAIDMILKIVFKCCYNTRLCVKYISIMWLTHNIRTCNQMPCSQLVWYFMKKCKIKDQVAAISCIKYLWPRGRIVTLQYWDSIDHWCRYGVTQLLVTCNYKLDSCGRQELVVFPFTNFVYNFNTRTQHLCHNLMNLAIISNNMCNTRLFD